MTKVKPLYLRLLIISFVILGFVLLGRHISRSTQAGNLSGVSVTMSNSRLSFRGKVAAVGGTIVTIELDDGIGNYIDAGTTDITDVLKVGDELIFPALTPAERVIQEIVDGTRIILDDTVTVGNTFYLAEESDLKVVFTTRTHLPGGSFMVMVPSIGVGNSAASQDGKPDQNFFDFGTGTKTIDCASAGSGHDFTGSTKTSAPWQTTISGYDGYWHTYKCTYTGGDNNEAITVDISSVINPAPWYKDATNKHVTGVADTYEVVVRHLDSTGTEVDATTVKVGVIEAVRVSATVVPSLTFTITGRGVGTTACGQTANVTTTASEVPLGELSTGAFTNAAQNLKVTTNAKDGAVVTAIANDQLGLNGAICVDKTYNSTYECIWNANVASMTHQDSTGTPGERNWTSTGEPGFGFSLEDNTDTDPDFEYNVGGTFMARHFADAEFGEEPQLLFSTDLGTPPKTGPTNDSNLYLCYRALADSVTAAGDYYNYITYTATATF